MELCGLQKLTLLDYPGKVACTVFTGGCNFRCPFCHNASLVLRPGQAEVLAEEKFWGFLQKRQGLLDGVCVTGGEPLLQKDLAAFLGKIKALGFLVKLDTNGSFPDQLAELLEHKLVDYVAMDIKNSREHYGLTTGLDAVAIENIEESVKLLEQKLVPYEFRTTVVRELHSREDFAAIGRWLSKDSPYFLQAFVDSGDLIGAHLTAYTKAEMEQMAHILRRTMKHVAIRGL